eukprot:1084095-Rhodomonas_salina.1
MPLSQTSTPTAVCRKKNAVLKALKACAACAGTTNDLCKACRKRLCGLKLHFGRLAPTAKRMHDQATGL